MVDALQFLPGTGRWQPAWADGGAVPRCVLVIAAPTNCPSVTPMKNGRATSPFRGGLSEGLTFLACGLEGRNE
jgi:hypothetical protein